MVKRGRRRRRLFSNPRQKRASRSVIARKTVVASKDFESSTDEVPDNGPDIGALDAYPTSDDEDDDDDDEENEGHLLAKPKLQISSASTSQAPVNLAATTIAVPGTIFKVAPTSALSAASCVNVSINNFSGTGLKHGLQSPARGVVTDTPMNSEVPDTNTSVVSKILYVSPKRRIRPNENFDSLSVQNKRARFDVVTLPSHAPSLTTPRITNSMNCSQNSVHGNETIIFNVAQPQLTALPPVGVSTLGHITIQAPVSGVVGLTSPNPLINLTSSHTTQSVPEFGRDFASEKFTEEREVQLHIEEDEDQHGDQYSILDEIEGNECSLPTVENLNNSTVNVSSIEAQPLSSVTMASTESVKHALVRRVSLDGSNITPVGSSSPAEGIISFVEVPSCITQQSVLTTPDITNLSGSRSIIHLPTSFMAHTSTLTNNTSTPTHPNIDSLATLGRKVVVATPVLSNLTSTQITISSDPATPAVSRQIPVSPIVLSAILTSQPCTSGTATVLSNIKCEQSGSISCTLGKTMQPAFSLQSTVNNTNVEQCSGAAVCSLPVNSGCTCEEVSYVKVSTSLQDQTVLPVDCSQTRKLRDSVNLDSSVADKTGSSLSVLSSQVSSEDGCQEGFSTQSCDAAPNDASLQDTLSASNSPKVPMNSPPTGNVGEFIADSSISIASRTQISNSCLITKCTQQISECKATISEDSTSAPQVNYSLCGLTTLPSNSDFSSENAVSVSDSEVTKCNPENISFEPITKVEPSDEDIICSSFDLSSPALCPETSCSNMPEDSELLVPVTKSVGSHARLDGEGGNIDGEGGNAPRRRRIAFTPRQYKLLQTTFEHNNFPEPAEQRSIAQQLGAPYRSIKMWFQNKRAAVRKRLGPDAPRAAGSPRTKYKNASDANSCFYCDLCPAAFIALPFLKRHKELHDVKTYNCPECNAAFTHPDLVVTHARARRCRDPAVIHGKTLPNHQHRKYVSDVVTVKSQSPEISSLLKSSQHLGIRSDLSTRIECKSTTVLNVPRPHSTFRLLSESISNSSNLRDSPDIFASPVLAKTLAENRTKFDNHETLDQSISRSRSNSVDTQSSASTQVPVSKETANVTIHDATSNSTYPLDMSRLKLLLQNNSFPDCTDNRINSPLNLSVGTVSNCNETENGNQTVAGKTDDLSQKVKSDHDGSCDTTEENYSIACSLQERACADNGVPALEPVSNSCESNEDFEANSTCNQPEQSKSLLDKLANIQKAILPNATANVRNHLLQHVLVNQLKQQQEKLHIQKFVSSDSTKKVSLNPGISINNVIPLVNFVTFASSFQQALANKFKETAETRASSVKTELNSEDDESNQLTYGNLTIFPVKSSPKEDWSSNSQPIDLSNRSTRDSSDSDSIGLDVDSERVNTAYEEEVELEESQVETIRNSNDILSSFKQNFLNILSNQKQIIEKNDSGVPNSLALLALLAGNNATGAPNFSSLHQNLLNATLLLQVAGSEKNVQADSGTQLPTILQNNTDGGKAELIAAEDKEHDGPSSNTDSQSAGKGSSSSNRPQRRRTTVFSETQHRILYQHFTHCNFPEPAMFRILAKLIGLEAAVIKIWFQNERSRQRKRAAYMIDGNKTFTEKPYKCLDCDMSFAMATFLVKHSARHSLQEPTATKCRVCPICTLKFENDVYNSHLKSVHQVDMALDDVKQLDERADESECLTCYLCLETFDDQEALYIHKRNHLTSKAGSVASCSICDTSFVNAVCLEAHMQTHYKLEWKHECEMCKTRFPEEILLKSHTMSHGIPAPSISSVNRYRSQTQEGYKKFVIHTHEIPRIDDVSVLEDSIQSDDSKSDIKPNLNALANFIKQEKVCSESKENVPRLSVVTTPIQICTSQVNTTQAGTPLAIRATDSQGKSCIQLVPVQLVPLPCSATEAPEDSDQPSTLTSILSHQKLSDLTTKTPRNTEEDISDHGMKNVVPPKKKIPDLIPISLFNSILLSKSKIVTDQSLCSEAEDSGVSMTSPVKNDSGSNSNRQTCNSNGGFTSEKQCCDTEFSFFESRNFTEGYNSNSKDLYGDCSNELIKVPQKHHASHISGVINHSQSVSDVSEFVGKPGGDEHCVPDEPFTDEDDDGKERDSEETEDELVIDLKDMAAENEEAVGQDDEDQQAASISCQQQLRQKLIEILQKAATNNNLSQIFAYKSKKDGNVEDNETFWTSPTNNLTGDDTINKDDGEQIEFKKYRNRREYTQEEQLILLAHFEHNHFPPARELKLLAKRLDITHRQIMHWFQNRRSKERKTLPHSRRVSRQCVDCKATFVHDEGLEHHRALSHDRSSVAVEFGCHVATCGLKFPNAVLLQTHSLQHDKREYAEKYPVEFVSSNKKIRKILPKPSIVNGSACTETPLDSLSLSAYATKSLTFTKPLPSFLSLKGRILSPLQGGQFPAVHTISNLSSSEASNADEQAALTGQPCKFRVSDASKKHCFANTDKEDLIEESESSKVKDFQIPPLLSTLKSFVDYEQLELHFEENNFPSLHELRSISEQFNIDVHFLSSWYKSRRNEKMSEVATTLLSLSPEPEFNCPMCSASFVVKRELQSHINLHSDPAAYVCKVCHAVFKHESVHLSHLNEHNAGVASQPRESCLLPSPLSTAALLAVSPKSSSVSSALVNATSSAVTSVSQPSSPDTCSISSHLDKYDVEAYAAPVSCLSENNGKCISSLEQNAPSKCSDYSNHDDDKKLDTLSTHSILVSVSGSSSVSSRKVSGSNVKLVPTSKVPTSQKALVCRRSSSGNLIISGVHALSFEKSTTDAPIGKLLIKKQLSTDVKTAASSDEITHISERGTSQENSSSTHKSSFLNTALLSSTSSSERAEIYGSKSLKSICADNHLEADVQDTKYSAVAVKEAKRHDGVIENVNIPNKSKFVFAPSSQNCDTKVISAHELKFRTVESDRKLSRSTKRELTANHAKVLEQFWTLNSSVPSKRRQQMIARQLQLPTRTVAKWLALRRNQISKGLKPQKQRKNMFNSSGGLLYVIPTSVSTKVENKPRSSNSSLKITLKRSKMKRSKSSVVKVCTINGEQQNSSETTVDDKVDMECSEQEGIILEPPAMDISEEITDISIVDVQYDSTIKEVDNSHQARKSSSAVDTVQEFSSTICADNVEPTNFGSSILESHRNKIASMNSIESCNSDDSNQRNELDNCNSIFLGTSNISDSNGNQVNSLSNENGSSKLPVLEDKSVVSQKIRLADESLTTCYSDENSGSVVFKSSNAKDLSESVQDPENESIVEANRVALFTKSCFSTNEVLAGEQAELQCSQT